MTAGCASSEGPRRPRQNVFCDLGHHTRSLQLYLVGHTGRTGIQCRRGPTTQGECEYQGQESLQTIVWAGYHVDLLCLPTHPACAVHSRPLPGPLSPFASPSPIPALWGLSRGQPSLCGAWHSYNVGGPLQDKEDKKILLLQNFQIIWWSLGPFPGACANKGSQFKLRQLHNQSSSGSQVSLPQGALPDPLT